MFKIIFQRKIDADISKMIYTVFLQEKWRTELILESSRLDNSIDVQESAFFVKEIVVNINISFLNYKFDLGLWQPLRSKGAVLFDFKITRFQ